MRNQAWWNHILAFIYSFSLLPFTLVFHSISLETHWQSLSSYSVEYKLCIVSFPWFCLNGLHSRRAYLVYCRDTLVRVPELLGIICSANFCKVRTIACISFYCFIIVLFLRGVFISWYRSPRYNLAANLFVAIIAVLEFRLILVLDYFNVIDIKGPMLCGVQAFFKSKWSNTNNKETW